MSIVYLCNDNNTFPINKNDEEVEMGVESRLLRPSLQSALKKKKNTNKQKRNKARQHEDNYGFEFRTGDRIEAKFGGKEKWFPGMYAITVIL